VLFSCIWLLDGMKDPSWLRVAGIWLVIHHLIPVSINGYSLRRFLPCSTPVWAFPARA
jgi:hypothetical protein